MKKILLASLLALAALPLVAAATEKSYTFVEGGYVNVDNDADGTYVRGNYNIGNTRVYMTGARSSVRINGTDADVRQGELGLGYHYAVNDRVDVIGEGTRVHVGTDAGTANGYRATVGTRFDITDDVEGQLNVNHYNGGDFSAENTGTATVLYKFGKVWAVDGSVEFNNQDNEAYSVGLSAAF